MINTPGRLEAALDEIIEKAVTDFREGLNKTEVNLFRQLQGLLRELSIDSKGNIKRTAANRRVLARIKRDLQKVVLTDAYKTRVRSFLGAYSTIGGANDEYLSFLEAAFKRNGALWDVIKSEAIEQTTASLTGAGLDQNLINPIRDILSQNITTGGSVAALEDQLRLEILGNSERLGRLPRYTGQITRDALNQFSANYHTAATSDLGLEWYFYTRGKVRDSREFCIKRQGNYYHVSEVRAWGNIKQWQGRIPGTNENTIFIYRGGFSCQHQILAVSQLAVPKSDIERAKSKGLI